MSELKPCPFCGSEAVIKKYFIKGVANHLNYFVACKCEIRTRSRKNIDGATSDWNSRPIEDALRAENERLRKALKDINITACYGWRDAEEALAKIATDAADALSPSTDESEESDE